ncbi:MAG: insulinase family protein, partial [Pseudomonadota bacterium]
MMKIVSGFSVFLIAFLMVTALAFSPFSARAEVVDLSGMYVLQNGLDVRLMPDPGTPVVAALVLVRTGYADEGRSRSGFSHLLEHLVFAGTQKRTKYEIQREVDDLGGYVNGFTRDDFTGYLIAGHRDHLGRLLDILADMLFNSTISEEGVREAKAVVLEEILRSRSRPESADAERFQALLYEGSPYAKTGLGNGTTVTASTREEIENFYRRTYRPDNMILLLRGGFNEAKALDAVSDAFGPAVMGAQKEPVELPEPILADRVYRVQGESPDIRVRIGFNGPRPRNRDSQVLELLAGTLGGDGGILERALASAGFQPRSVLAYLSVNEGFSRFIITSQFPAGTDPSAVRSVMLESVKAFIDSKSFEEEMNRTRRSMVSAEIMGREKLHYFLMGKAQWIISGSPGQGLSPGRWDSITADDLRAAVLKYVTGKPSVSLFTVPEMNGQALERTTTPVKAEAMLDNGLQVVAEQRPGSEVFALHLMTRSRSAVEPENREGIADFLHRLLSRGTASRTREELSDELRSLGASLSTAGDPTVPFGDFYTSRLYSYIRLECVMEAA